MSTISKDVSENLTKDGTKEDQQSTRVDLRQGGSPFIQEDRRWFSAENRYPKKGEQERSGTFGRVLLRDSNACKFFKQTWTEDCSLTREILTLRAIQHPNILPVNKIYFDGEKQLCMVSPRATLSLFEWWFSPNSDRFRKPPLNLRHRCAYIPIVMYQLFSAFAHLHALKIIHRDFKSGNAVVRLTADHLPHILVIDFGSCRLMGDPDSSDSFTRDALCTVNYRAPELWRDSLPSWHSDMFSIGAVFFELLSFSMLFRAMDGANDRGSFEAFAILGKQNLKQNLEQTLEGNLHAAHAGKMDISAKKQVRRRSLTRTEFEKQFASYVKSNEEGDAYLTPQLLSRFRDEDGIQYPFVNAAALDLLLKLLHPNPAQRITAAAALKHPYLNSDTQTLSDITRLRKELAHFMPRLISQRAPSAAQGPSPQPSSFCRSGPTQHAPIHIPQTHRVDCGRAGDVNGTPSSSSGVQASSSIISSSSIGSSAKVPALSSSFSPSPKQQENTLSALSPYCAPFTRSLQLQLSRLALVKSLLALKEKSFPYLTNATTWIAYQILLWLQHLRQTKGLVSTNTEVSIGQASTRVQPLASQSWQAEVLKLTRCSEQELLKLSLAIAAHFNQNVNFEAASTDGFRRLVIRIVLFAAEQRFLPIMPQLGIPDAGVENLLVWCVFCFGGRNLDQHKREALFVWDSFRNRKPLPSRIWATMMCELIRTCRNDYHLGLALPSQQLLRWAAACPPVAVVQAGKP